MSFVPYLKLNFLTLLHNVTQRVVVEIIEEQVAIEGEEFSLNRGRQTDVTMDISQHVVVDVLEGYDSNYPVVCKIAIVFVGNDGSPPA